MQVHTDFAGGVEEGAADAETGGAETVAVPQRRRALRLAACAWAQAAACRCFATAAYLAILGAAIAVGVLGLFAEGSREVGLAVSVLGFGIGAAKVLLALFAPERRALALKRLQFRALRLSRVPGAPGTAAALDEVSIGVFAAGGGDASALAAPAAEEP